MYNFIDKQCFLQGFYYIYNMTLDFDDFPYLPIFTWSELRAQSRLDVNFTRTSTGETILYAYGIGIVTQTLESKSIKVPSYKPKSIY